MIAIVDYGVGNLGSIVNMARRAGADAARVTTAEEIDAAERVVLPGVGAFDACVRALDASGLRPAVERAALEDRRPFLGICVGMQLLGRASEEGELAGLGWIDAVCRRLSPTPEEPGLKIPHMGWSELKVVRDDPLLDPTVDGRPQRFYFLHSYAMACEDERDVLATAAHGREFVCAVQRGNIRGVQFHPEKSHRFGLELFRRFAAV